MATLGAIHLALACALELRYPAHTRGVSLSQRYLRDTIRKQSLCSPIFQKNSGRLWRSRRRKSSSFPAGAANFPAAVFLAGKCPNLGRDSISRCRKIAESFSSSVKICRKTFPAGNFGQPQPSRVFCFLNLERVFRDMGDLALTASLSMVFSVSLT